MSSSIVIYYSLKDVMPRKQNITSSLTHVSDSLFDSFVPNAPFLYTLKTSENLEKRGRKRVHSEQMG